MRVFRRTGADTGTRRARRRLAAACAITVTAAGAGAAGTQPAFAQDTRPSIAVSIGDSYISGEGGRWQGNAAPWYYDGDIWGTDRAAYACESNGTTRCLYDPARIYGTTHRQCDRSDVAEIISAHLPMATASRNLACSGAKTVNVIRRQDGGEPFKGEAPQADQLETLARQYDVKFIVVSIGGNDLNFTPIMEQCAVDYGFGIGPCSSGPLPATFHNKLTMVRDNVRRALQSIRNAMRADGYTDTDYRLVLQSYPEPVPNGADFRYPQSGFARLSTGGCPLYDADADWAHDTVVPDVSAQLAIAAQLEGADFLSLRHAFDGHELCAKRDRQALPNENQGNPVNPDFAEWIRFVSVFDQGIVQESLHPNAFGQQALGDCLAKLYREPHGAYSCSNSAGHSPYTMQLNPL